jgi:hypothetical protein
VCGGYRDQSRNKSTKEEIHGKKKQWRKMSKVAEINWRKRSMEEKING